MKNKTVKIIALCVCFAVICGVVASTSALALWQNSDEYVRLDNDKLSRVQGSVTLLDNKGSVLCEPASVGGKKQTSIAALPKHVYMAFVAVEDKRFFRHDGVDIVRVASALLTNLKSGGKKEGASTITQQLIKNTHLSGEKTYKRKLNEMILARELERNFSKTEILEMYLNTIYFGRSSYGIENAANVYFGKTAHELTVAEAATLAAMIKAPNVYAPDKNAGKCLVRRNRVLDLMCKQGVISQNDCNAAKATEVAYTPYSGNNVHGYTDGAIAEACRLLNLTEAELLAGRYVIETFCDSETQSALSKLVAADETTDKEGNLTSLSATMCTSDGKVTACAYRGTFLTRRQAGSTLKPIAVYTPAFDVGACSVVSPVLDEKTDFNGYCPTNVGGYKGWTTIKDAVLTSSNVPAVKTLNALTLPVSEKYLAKLGFTGKQDLSLALGNIRGGVNETDLLHCYTALADGGTAHKVRFVSKIYDDNGLVYDNKDKPVTVYSSGASYLMTDLLCRNAQIGTARKLAATKIDVAAKTGTVGDKCGNTDALTVGYTTSNVFVVRHSGELSNSVNGTTAPCKLLADILATVYKNRKPDKFTKPPSVSFRCVNEAELYGNQRLVLDNCGTPYPFLLQYAPD